MTATPSTREARAHDYLASALREAGHKTKTARRICNNEYVVIQAAPETLVNAMLAFATAEQQRSDDVRAAAIEECAKVAEEKFAAPEWHPERRMAGNRIASAIRDGASKGFDQ